MADLSKLTASGAEAVKACNTAPLLVRGYLAPLRDFVAEVVTALHDLNAQAAGGSTGGKPEES